MRFLNNSVSNIPWLPNKRATKALIVLLTAFSMVSGHIHLLVEKESKNLTTESPSTNRPNIFDIQVSVTEKEAHVEDNPENDPAEAFIDTLKSFLFDTHFSADGFEVRAEKLEKSLVEVEAWAKDNPSSKHIERKISFARHMFEEMADSVETFKCYDSVDRVDHHLVRCLVGLNVRLFYFYESRGVPNPRKAKYVSKVIGFSNLINEWYAEFQALSKLRYGIRRKFKKVFLQVESKLQALETFSW